MARVTEIELTSRSEGGAWNWRAVGARQPRGTLSGDLVPSGSSVGDVLRAELEFAIEGIEVVALAPSKTDRRDEARGQRIELISSPLHGPEISVTYASGGARPGRDGERGRGREDGPGRRDGARRGPGPGRDGPARAGGARRPPRPRSSEQPTGESADTDAERRGPRPGPRPERSGRRPEGAERSGRRPEGAERSGRRPEGAERSGRRPEGAERDGQERAPRPGVGPARGRRPTTTVAATHRNAMLAELRPEQVPVAEQLLRGGMPAVRQAIAEQNTAATRDGQPAVAAEPFMAMAEELLAVVNLAAWKDRAAAAQAAGREFRLRELRAVVAAARTVSLDEAGRVLSKALQESLTQRQGALRDDWTARMTAAIDGGRVLDAVRLSARPPEPALRLSAELAVRLAAAAGAAMPADLAPEAWLALLMAVLESPVRRNVKPAGLPDAPETKEAARRAAGSVPELAKLIGLRIPPPPPRRTIGRQPVSAASAGVPTTES